MTRPIVVGKWFPLDGLIEEQVGGDVFVPVLSLLQLTDYMTEETENYAVKEAIHLFAQRLMGDLSQTLIEGYGHSMDDPVIQFANVIGLIPNHVD